MSKGDPGEPGAGGVKPPVTGGIDGPKAGPVLDGPPPVAVGALRGGGPELPPRAAGPQHCAWPMPDRNTRAVSVNAPVTNCFMFCGGWCWAQRARVALGLNKGVKIGLRKHQGACPSGTPLCYLYVLERPLSRYVPFSTVRPREQNGSAPPISPPKTPLSRPYGPLLLPSHTPPAWPRSLQHAPRGPGGSLPANHRPPRPSLPRAHERAQGAPRPLVWHEE